MESFQQMVTKSLLPVVFTTCISLIIWGFSVETRLDRHQTVISKGEYMLRSEGNELIKQVNMLAVEQASSSAKLAAVLDSLNRNKRLTEQLILNTNRINARLENQYSDRELIKNSK